MKLPAAFLLAVVPALPAHAAPDSNPLSVTPQGVATELREARLDPEQCYRVRDLHFTRGEDLRFYLTDGHLIFAKPVAGRQVAAVFVADTEGGDAELLVLPPDRGERMSLAGFTGSPNLDEHFRTALFLFTDDTGDVLRQAIERQRATDSGASRPAPERGALIAADWNRVMATISGSFSVRLAEHILRQVPAEEGVFYSALQGVKLGNFDAVYDPYAPEQVFLGQLKHRDERAFYDTWTSFAARPFRIGRLKTPAPDFTVASYRIDARLGEDLRLQVRTVAGIRVDRAGTRLLAFDVSDGMEVTAARLRLPGAAEPEECMLYSPDSFRANLLRRGGSKMVLVMTPRPLASGDEYEIEFEHEGGLVMPAGRDVYFVGSRSNWYPRAGNTFAGYDITFRYPAHLDLVFPGDLVEERTADNERVARRVTPAPIRLAGFNLGKYEQWKQKRGALTVEVYANRRAEPSLRSAAPDVVILPEPRPPFPRRGQPGVPDRVTVMPLPRYFPDPTARLQAMTDEIADAFAELAARLGPPALPSLMVSPIPGTFGQGFPGLVYLSTISYLNPGERPAGARESQKQLFFSEILHAHEIAHQWWGNVVTTESPGDEWLLEALANYSALMLLEKRKGAKAVQSVLDDYREQLLRKDGEGKTEESAGPIQLGMRLRSSQSPDAWHHIVYGKGSWILHMLRHRIGDDAFWKLLGELCMQYRQKPLSTGQFEQAAAAYLPKGDAEPFFDHWVHGTGVPEFTMTQRWRAGKLTVTVTQSGVPDETILQVPVEVHARGAKPGTQWVTTSDDPGVLTIPLRAAPLRVSLDPERMVLRQ